MIDYYKAIDTETGQEVPYLREVSNRISPEMSMRSYNMTENLDRLRERPWKLTRGRPLVLAMYQVKRKSLLNLLR